LFGVHKTEAFMKAKCASVIVLAAALLVGCATPLPRGIHTSRLRDVNAGKFYLRVDQFGSGETPAAVVTGFVGRAITVKVFNIGTGSLVRTITAHVAEAHTHWWRFTDLPDGSYQAVLLIDGGAFGTANFDVIR